MEWIWWTLGGIACVLLLCLGVSYYCYRRVFYSPPRKPLGDGEYRIPPGEEYEKYRDAIIRWADLSRTLPHEDLSITSRDGLTLRGRYYEYAPDAPVELLFHGYQGDGERDMSAGIERCASLGRSALIVDHRGSGKSDGNTITFGIKERKDCIDWTKFAAEKFGKERKLFIAGISMGGATVAMMSADPELPDNVAAGLCDCPYSSAREIIMKVVGEMHLPQHFVYPFIKLGARLFGGFDLEEESPINAVKHSQIPLIFIHGTADSFVPHEMSLKLYEATASDKAICLIDGAPHGLSFPTDKEKYVTALREFQSKY